MRSLFSGLILVAASLSAQVVLTTLPQNERPGFAVGDLDGDGFGDLVVNGPRGLLVYRGLAQGVAAQPVTYPFVTGRPFVLDWDKDRKPDVVIAGPSTVLFRGNGDGSLQPLRVIAPGGLLLADLNSDGLPDVFSYDPGGSRVRVYLGEPGGAVRSIPVESSVPFLEGSIKFADLNNDGRMDLVYRAARTRAGWLLGDGTGAFTARGEHDTGSQVSELFFADINGDGRADLICNDFVQPNPANPAFAADRILVFTATPAGTFAASPAVLARNLYLHDAVDLNGDGLVDLVAHDSLFFGSGDGSFVRSSTFASFANVAAHIVARVNADALPDVVAQLTPLGGANVLGTYLNPAQATRSSLRGPAGEGTNLVPAGIPITLTFSVAPALGGSLSSGRVVLRNGTTIVASADLDRPSLSLTWTPAPGRYTLTAHYVGPLPFAPSTSAPLTVFAGTLMTTTELVATPARPVVGQPVELAATVRAPVAVPLPGSIEFRQDARVLGVSPLQNGVARFTVDRLEAGTQTFRAVYSGGPQVAASEASLEIGARGGLSVVSSASGQNLVAPESIASAYGTGLGSPALAVANSIPLPLELGGRRVRIRDAAGVDRLASLYFVSLGQINFVVPDGSRLGSATVSVLDSTGAILAEGPATISPAAPALFQAAGGRHLAAYTVTQRPDGSRPIAFTHSCSATGVCEPVPIDVMAGEVVLVMFGTGLRGDRNLRVRVDGLEIQPSFAGPQAEYPGLDQVNITLPATLAGRGDVPVMIETGFMASPASLVRIR